MTGSTPPWRLLDADDETPSAPTVPQPAAARGIGDASNLRTIGLLGLAGLLAIGAFILATGRGDGADVAVESSGAPVGLVGSPVAQGPDGAAEVVVEVAGAVREPGLFRVPTGTRVGDVIAMAGGYGPRVDARRVDVEVNLAAVVTDGQRVRVPSRDDVPAVAVASPPAEGSATGGGAAIDLNTATLEQLDTLPGIGPVTAEKILAAREEAPFTAVEELRSRGILGEKTFEQVRPLVTVS